MTLDKACNMLTKAKEDCLHWFWRDFLYFTDNLAAVVTSQDRGGIIKKIYSLKTYTLTNLQQPQVSKLGFEYFLAVVADLMDLAVIILPGYTI